MKTRGSLLQIKKSVGLTDVYQSDRRCKTDDDIKGISNKPIYFRMAQYKALRDELLSLKNQEICNGMPILYTERILPQLRC
jgi:hypothetical protein